MTDGINALQLKKLPTEESGLIDFGTCWEFYTLLWVKKGIRMNGWRIFKIPCFRDCSHTKPVHLLEAGSAAFFEFSLRSLPLWRFRNTST